ncbi:MAG: uroporphyrinogen-III C-methyltransferase [Methyloversatilis sp.]|jgi:uroporphyrin-III C-methyltransferase|nr:uroporphyrinogen-III C-methyltransferase [Methyloversatilis sp.]
MYLLDEPHLARGGSDGHPPSPGCARVTLVGAGPGDPDLLTVKAMKVLQGASLVLYDHLVSKDVLHYVPSHADLIYVGKESSRHTLPQDEIIELMVRLAKGGRPVVRLKGGDGYIFGRGGEEALALARAGVPFDVVPGLSAAQGAGASAGIPLTHRDHAQALIFVTGHRQQNEVIDLDWTMLARPRQTVVIYMGIANLQQICGQLIAHGLPADTPAAVIERATLPDERCVTGSVRTLPTLAIVNDVKPPALVVIGEVVSLQRELSAAGRRSAAR